MNKGKKPGTKDARVFVFMTKEFKERAEKRARDAGMPLAAFIRHLLNPPAEDSRKITIPFSLIRGPDDRLIEQIDRAARKSGLGRGLVLLEIVQLGLSLEGLDEAAEKFERLSLRLREVNLLFSKLEQDLGNMLSQWASKSRRRIEKVTQLGLQEESSIDDARFRLLNA